MVLSTLSGPLRTWELGGKGGGGSDKPAFRMAKGQRGAKARILTIPI